jgi:FSR family fosmidomycin resistance protein-like MFS transporter
VDTTAETTVDSVPVTTVAVSPADTTVEMPGYSKEKLAMRVLIALSFSHFLNDLIQSLVPAVYPLLKVNFDLTFGQIGVITLTYQLAASLLQPFVGYFTDKRPLPYSLPVGMFSTLTGLVILAFAPTFPIILIGAAFIGIGSAIFHPESSRMARTAAGGRHGFAQSFFQIGGNAGSAIGPLLAAFIILPYGQPNMAWFSLAAFLAIVVLSLVSHWYKTNHLSKRRGAQKVATPSPYTRKEIIVSLIVLMVLIFSKYFYMSSLTSYYTFYLIEKFGISVQDAQLLLFLFLAAVAVGTFFGGPIGDKVGRKYVIWVSILGVLPFTILLPHANLLWTAILSVIIGLIISSAFSAIIVYAQELIPGHTGLVAGLFFGFAFGMGGLGAAFFGGVADKYGIEFVYSIACYLPALGILTIFLPNEKRLEKQPIASAPPLAVEGEKR